MARLAGSSCSSKRPATTLVAIAVVVAALVVSAAAASADGEVKKKAPECHTVATCETGWCDGKCRGWGFTDPIGAYCTYGGTLTRCCCGSIGAVNASASAAGDLHIHQQQQQQLVQ